MMKQKIGKSGEDIAARYLRQQGYRILGRGVHAGRLGELDIVAFRDGMLVFVEVKARRTSRFGSPEEAVTSQKVQKLQRAIGWYRQRQCLERMPYRLDVIAIEWRGGMPAIRHHRSVGVG